MGVFVNYPSNIFSGITSTPTTIITASTNVLLVNSIIICNTGAQNIRFNLKKLRTQTDPVTISYITEYEIKAYGTVDIAAEFGLQIFLTYSTSPSVSDSLFCFSNGYTQSFDCEITYTQLKDLPYP